MSERAMNPEPNVDERGVPFCQERCHCYDGKRCELTGFRPGGICEPAVIEMAALLRAKAGAE